MSFGPLFYYLKSKVVLPITLESKYDFQESWGGDDV